MKKLIFTLFLFINSFVAIAQWSNIPGAATWQTTPDKDSQRISFGAWGLINLYRREQIDSLRALYLKLNSNVAQSVTGSVPYTGYPFGTVNLLANMSVNGTGLVGVGVYIHNGGTAIGSGAFLIDLHTGTNGILNDGPLLQNAVIKANQFRINFASGSITNHLFQWLDTAGVTMGTVYNNSHLFQWNGQVQVPNMGSTGTPVGVVNIDASGNLFVGSGGGSTANPLTMNNGGAGAASGTTFDGSVSRTISYNTIGAAPLLNPAFTGIPTAATAIGGTNTSQLATTAFVQNAIPSAGYGLTGNLSVDTASSNAIVSKGRLATNLVGYAKLASPALTGVPTAPTATFGTNTTQLATTAFVLANDTAGISTITSLGTHENASIAGSNLNIPNIWPRVWQPMGTVMVPYTVADGSNLQEPNVIYEGSPQILTNATNVYKNLFTAGGATQGIYYAESSDGQSWSRYATVCIANHARTCLYKESTTYYAFCVPTTGGSAFLQVDLYSSTDMINWTLSTAGIVTVSGAASVANMVVIKDGSTYQMLLSYNVVGGGPFVTGYFHSTSLTSGWTAYGSNPVMGNTTNLELQPGGAGAFQKVGSTYYAWMFGGTTTGNLPTDIYRYHSTNLTTWTADNSGSPTYPRTQSDEGVGQTNGQAANPSLVTVSGITSMYYSAVTNGSGLAFNLHLKRAVANYTIANLVNTNEGNGGYLTLAQPYYTQAASNLNFIPNASNVGADAVWTTGSILMQTDASAFGLRLRDGTTNTTFSFWSPNSLNFYQSGGVANTIASSSSGITFTSGGFNGKFDNSGQFTTPALSISGLTTQNGVLYVSNTTGLVSQTTAGTSGYVLTSNGSGSAPTFQVASGGITLTTTGTSGAATYSGGNLNIPVYSSSSGGLTPTATKTANYTAVVGDMVMCNTTSGGFTITMPASPADGNQVGIHLLIQGSTNAITVHDGANNGFNNFLGNQTISYLDEVVIYQFKTSDGTWRTVSNNITESTLNNNYVSGTANATYTAQPTFYGGVLTEGTSSASRISLIDNGLYFVKSGTTTLLNGTSAGVSIDHPFILKGYTVSTLPSGVVGMTAYVTDALTPSFGVTLVGGGAVVTKAFYNGTNWISE